MTRRIQRGQVSHIVNIKTQLRDLEAVKAACSELGWEFVENAPTYASVNEYGAPVQNPCTHKIRVPGFNNETNRPHYVFALEIGLTKTAGAYSVSYDNLMEQGEWPGSEDISGIGKDACKLVSIYAAHKATIEARNLGYSVNRVACDNGEIHLFVTGIN